MAYYIRPRLKLCSHVLSIVRIHIPSIDVDFLPAKEKAIASLTWNIVILKLAYPELRVVLIVPGNVLKQNLQRNLPTLEDLIDELSLVG